MLEKALDDAHVLDADDDDDDDLPVRPRLPEGVPEADERSSWRDSTCSYTSARTSEVGSTRPSDVTLDEPMERSGFLLKRSGVFSQLNRRFFVLKEGTLLWYKTERDAAPAGFCHLCEARSITQHPQPQGERAGSVKLEKASKTDDLGGLRRTSSEVAPKPDGKAAAKAGKADGSAALMVRALKDYVLHADDASERDKWLRALTHNRHYPPLAGLAPPTQSVMLTPSGKQADGAHAAGGGASKAQAKAEKRSMLSNLAFKAEKKMVGRAVTSDLGKKLLREYCLPETFTLLQALRDMASLDPAVPPKHGARIEDTILKMCARKRKSAAQPHAARPAAPPPAVRPPAVRSDEAPHPVALMRPFQGRQDCAAAPARQAGQPRL